MGVQKLKKGGRVCQIETDKEGLYLGTANGKGIETVGIVFYLMKQGGLYEVGLILGHNSPFKNILILGMIV